MKLAKFNNSIVPRTDLGIGLDIKLECKLIKSLIKTNNKMHKPKSYNKAIANLIYGNK